MKKKTKKKVNKKLECPECPWGFGTFANEGLLASHKKHMHPPPPPPVEDWVTDGVPGDLDETLTLTGASNERLQTGDVFYHVRKFVVMSTKRKTLDGVLQKDKTIVVAKCTQRHWQENKPL